MTSIVVASENTTYDSRGNCNAIIEKSTNKLVAGCISTVIPNTVTSIGRYAFYKRTSLASIEIPNSVTSIEVNAFNNCRGLTAITLPNSITRIEYYAFEYCSALTSITIPNSVVFIGNGTFAYCTSLSSIIVEQGNSNYDSRNNCNAIIETSSNTLIAGCKNTIIPNSVTSIYAYAFCGCTGLTSIIIPEGVTSIEENAFQNCDGLTSITIPSSLTNIGQNAFTGSYSLADITFGDGLCLKENHNQSGLDETRWYSNQPNGIVYAGQTAIYYKGTMPAGTQLVIKEGTLGICTGTFASRDGLISVTIPNSVTYISSSAFQNCSNLASISFGNGLKGIGENALDGTAWYNDQPDGVVYAGKVAYKYKGTMPAETQITLNEETVGIADYAFDGNINLTHVTIPDGVTSIGRLAFNQCSGLTSVVIGRGVTSIGEWAFQSCSGLTTVISKIVEPFAFGRYAFLLINSTSVLVVPKGTRDAYIAEGWTESVFGGGIVEDGIDVTITAAGYATFYNTGVDRNTPEGVTAFTAKIHNGAVLLSGIEGGKIPANTPVVLKGAPDTYCFTYTTDAETVGENQLRVSPGSLEADGTQYALTVKSGSAKFNKIKVGTSIPAGKVYLLVPSPGTKEFFNLEEDDPTGIDSPVEVTEKAAAIYNIAGQRINKLQNGINIINNKKILYK